MARDLAEGPKTLLVFGIGELGGPLVDALAGRYPAHKYVVVSRTSRQAKLRANLTRYLCSQWSSYPEVRWDATNLLDVDRTAELIARHRPDVVFNATTPFPWWRIDSMPPADRQLAHRAGPGMWCALDCLLPMKLSEALAGARSTAQFVNACYPDMVNAFLRDFDRPPTVGIGNLSNLVPGLRLAFGTHLAVHPRDVAIQLVCHHFTSLNAPTMGGAGGAPYHLTVQHPEGRLEFQGTDDTPFALVSSICPRVRGLEGQGVTVMSAATVAASLLNAERAVHHTPGPMGLPGGYPVELAEDGTVSLNLPAGLSREGAIAINAHAQRFDGVEEVVPGTVTPTDSARRALQAVVGMDIGGIAANDVLPISREIVDRLNARFSLGLSL